MSDQLTDVEREMAWTSWADACRDPAIHDDLRQCRRRRGHDGEHASGFGTEARRWDR